MPSPEPHLQPTSPSTPSVPRTPPAPAPPPFSLARTFLLEMPAVTSLTLVRHGQQQRPTTEVFTPSEWVDAPLSALGQRQAEAVAAALSKEKVDTVVCSHLSRAHETGRSIARHHGLEPAVYPELREIETYRDLPDGTSPNHQLPEVVWRGLHERFLTERRWDLMPFGEGSTEFRHRVVTIVEGLLLAHAGEHVVIACHGGVINAYLAHVLGIDEDMFFMPGHASLSRVRAGAGRRALHSVNETHHLQAVDPELVTH